jgi:hypothetical protein
LIAAHVGVDGLRGDDNYNLQRAFDENEVFDNVSVLTLRDGYCINASRSGRLPSIGSVDQGLLPPFRIVWKEG